MEPLTEREERPSGTQDQPSDTEIAFVFASEKIQGERSETFPFLMTARCESAEKETGGAPPSFIISNGSGDGELIKRAKARMGLLNLPENVSMGMIWCEALMMHLDTPLPANISIPEDSPLLGGDVDAESDEAKIVRMIQDGVVFRSEVESQDARDALFTMTLQPVDMRDDATGHERERLYTLNGISGVVVESEIRNGNELWVAFAFWSREFPEKTRFLFNNIAFMGMSIDMGTSKIALSPLHPQTILFKKPTFNGGCILFQQLAADKKTYFGAVAETDKTTSKPVNTNHSNEGIETDTFSEENLMDPKEIVSLAKELAEATAEGQDKIIQRLDAALSEAQGKNLTELKDEIKATLKAEYDEKLLTSETEAQATINDLNTQVTSLSSDVTRLEGELSEANAKLAKLETEAAEREAAALRAETLKNRIAELDAISTVTAEERSAEFDETVATASDAEFAILVKDRKIAALESKLEAAANGDVEKEEEIKTDVSGVSAFASLKTAPEKAGDLASLVDLLTTI